MPPTRHHLSCSALWRPRCDPSLSSWLRPIGSRMWTPTIRSADVFPTCCGRRGSRFSPAWRPTRSPDWRRLSPGCSRRMADSVRALLGRQIGGLPVKCRQLLEVASVAGVEFEIEVLAEAVGTDFGETVARIDQVITAHVVQGRGPGRCAFAHGLFRDAVYEALGEARRATLHERAGEGLERFRDRGRRVDPAELAHHFVAASRWGNGRRRPSTPARLATRRFARSPMRTRCAITSGCWRWSTACRAAMMRAGRHCWAWLMPPPRAEIATCRAECASTRCGCGGHDLCGRRPRTWHDIRRCVAAVRYGTPLRSGFVRLSLPAVPLLVVHRRA